VNRLSECLETEGSLQCPQKLTLRLHPNPEVSRSYPARRACLQIQCWLRYFWAIWRR